MFVLIALKVKPAPLGGHLFRIDLYEKILKNIIIQTHMAKSFDIWPVPLPRKTIQILFKLLP